MSKEALEKIDEELEAYQLEKKIKQLEKDIAAELKPFFKSIMSMNKKSRQFEIFTNALKNYIKRLRRGLTLIKFASADLQELEKDFSPGKVSKLDPGRLLNIVFFILH